MLPMMFQIVTLFSSAFLPDIFLLILWIFFVCNDFYQSFLLWRDSFCKIPLNKTFLYQSVSTHAYMSSNQSCTVFWIFSESIVLKVMLLFLNIFFSADKFEVTIYMFPFMWCLTWYVLQMFRVNTYTRT